MSSPSQSDLARSGTLEELYGKLDKVGMSPGWNKPTPSLWPAPRRTFVIPATLPVGRVRHAEFPAVVPKAAFVFLAADYGSNHWPAATQN
jgi:hypothetical protein